MLTKTEDCRFLTDRWGQALDIAGCPLSQADHDAIDRLTPHMWDEVCFIVERNGAYGILVETEFDENYTPPPAVISAWTSHAREAFGVDGWHTHGSHVFFGRYAQRAFIPEAMVTSPLVDRIGHAALGLDQSAASTNA